MLVNAEGQFYSYDINQSYALLKQIFPIVHEREEEE